MYFIYKLLLLGFTIIFREYIYICYSKKEIRKNKKNINPILIGPLGAQHLTLARALAPPGGRRLLLPLPQPPPTLSSSLSLHAPNSLRAPVIHRAPLATRLLPCSLRICPLGDLARWLCASTPDRRPPHLHKPTPSPSPRSPPLPMDRPTSAPRSAPPSQLLRSKCTASPAPMWLCRPSVGTHAHHLDCA
jgi:hypothetical protein